MTTLLEDLEQTVRQTAAKFPSEVVKIRYTVGHNWSGDPAINFRIVLSDDAARREHLSEIAAPIREELGGELWASGYISYCYFRSKSERDALKDPEWE